MPEILPKEKSDEDMKGAIGANMDGGNVNETKPVADLSQAVNTKAPKTPTAEKQEAKKEKEQKVGADTPTFSDESKQADGGNAPKQATPTSAGAVSPITDISGVPGETDTGEVDMTGAGTTVTRPVSGKLGNKYPERKSRIKGINERRREEDIIYRGMGDESETGTGKDAASLPYGAPTGQYNAVNGTLATNHIHWNQGPYQLQSMNGVYDPSSAKREVEDAAMAPVNQAQQDVQDLQDDVDAHQREIDQQDQDMQNKRGRLAQDSYLENQRSGSAYEHVEPQSSWGKENVLRNTAAIASNATGLADTAGKALKGAFDVFNSCLKMTFDGGLNPGNIGHAIGMSLDATGKVFDDAMKNIGASQGIDMDKLKKDPNAIGTFKGKKALQEEADIKNASLDSQRMAAQALAESIGWKGGEIRPEQMEAMLKNMTGDQMKAYGEKLMAAMDSNPDYQRITHAFDQWQAQNPGKPASQFRVSAKDKAIIAGYNQMLVPYKEALKESDQRYKLRAEAWKPYKQRYTALKRQINEAKRQGKRDAEAKLAELNQIYYDSIASPEEKDVLDVLGGPQGKYEVDDYGNVSQNDLHRARRILEARNITTTWNKAQAGQPLTASEERDLNAWIYVHKTLEADRQARRGFNEEQKARELEEYARTHTPLEVAMKAEGIDLSNRASYSKRVYGQTGVPKTYGLRGNVRDAADGVIAKLEQQAKVQPLNQNEQLMLNSAKNAKYAMDLQDRFESYYGVLERRASGQSGPITKEESERIKADMEKLRAMHVAEIKKYPIRDLQTATTVAQPNPQLDTMYKYFDDKYKISKEAKEFERQRRAEEKANLKNTEEWWKQENERRAQEEIAGRAKLPLADQYLLDHNLLENTPGWRLHVNKYGLINSDDEAAQKIRQDAKDIINNYLNKGAGNATREEQRLYDAARRTYKVYEANRHLDAAWKIVEKVRKSRASPAEKREVERDYNRLQRSFENMAKTVPTRGEEALDASDPGRTRRENKIINDHWRLAGKFTKVWENWSPPPKKKISKSALYMLAMNDPVVRDAFAKAKYTPEQKKKIQEEAAAAWAAEQEKMAEYQQRQKDKSKQKQDRAEAQKARKERQEARDKGLEEIQENRETRRKQEKEQRKHGGGRRTDTHVRDRTKPQYERTFSNNNRRAIENIKNPAHRQAAIAALDVIEGAYKNAKDTKRIKTGEYSIDTLNMIEEVVRRGLPNVDQQTKNWYAIEMTTHPELEKFVDAVKRMSRYTKDTHADNAVDPKKPTDFEIHDNGKAYTLRGIEGMGRRFFGDRFDMNDYGMRSATQVLSKAGFRDLPLSAGRDEYEATVERLDKAMTRTHNTPTLRALTGLRNQYILQYTRNALDNYESTLDLSDPKVKKQWIEFKNRTTDNLNDAVMRGTDLDQTVAGIASDFKPPQNKSKGKTTPETPNKDVGTPGKNTAEELINAVNDAEMIEDEAKSKSKKKPVEQDSKVDNPLPATDQPVDDNTPPATDISLDENEEVDDVDVYTD